MPAGPQGCTGYQELHLVDAQGAFPLWALRSKDGVLFLRLLRPRHPQSFMQLQEYLEAAIVSGIDANISEKTVVLHVTTPTAHIVSDGPWLAKYKKAHKVLTAVQEILPGNDPLYGFQAASNQELPPCISSESLQQVPGAACFKKDSCTQCAIILPMERFSVEHATSGWHDSMKALKEEQCKIQQTYRAAFQLAWLWLDSCLRAGSSNRRQAASGAHQ